MIRAYLPTWLFYGIAVLGELGILRFLGHIHYKAMQKTEEAEQLRWSSEDSRNTWIDVAKTMITSAGIAAALLATLAARQINVLSDFTASNVRTATVSLVVCVCVSMFLILALARGHEAAKSHYIQNKRREGCETTQIKEGPLSNLALRITLTAAFIALSTFFIGFLYLARIVWHI